MVTRALLLLLFSGCAAGPSKIVFHPNADGSPTPPLIVDPKPGAVIVDARPIITLALPPGTGIAHVEICRDEHCEALQAAIDTTTTKAQAPVELPSGIYWLRAGARAGDRFGKTGPLQRLAIERRATVRTEHFDLDGPGDAPAALPAMGRFAEQVLAFYVQYMGLGMPTDRLVLSYYATEDGYHFATHTLGADKLSEHAGFTRARHSYMRWPSPPARAAVAGAGRLEYLTAHELAHQVEYVASRGLAARMPPWLTEGAADFLAEMALASIYHLSDGELVGFFGRCEPARQARREKYAIPVQQFFDAKYEAWQRKEHRSDNLFYSQGYTLLRSLSLPVDRMRAFLRKLWAQGGNVDLFVGGLLRDAFGDPTAIQQRMDAWLDATPPSHVERGHLEVQLLEGGGWHLQTLDDRQEGVLGTGLSHPAAATLDLEAEFAPATRRIVLDLGGGTGLELFPDGRARLLGPGRRELGETQLAPLAGAHRLTLALGGGAGVLSVDGSERLRVAWTGGAGPVRLRVQGGQLLVRALRVTPRT
jgi:hypothetical protein